MKRQSVSKRSVNPDKITLPTPCEGYGLNVSFLYQDATTKKWAKEVSERVNQLNEPESLRCTWWKMGDLAQPGVLAGAVSIAMRADVLVLAMDAAQPLPYPVYAWVESWLPHRYQSTGALLALMGNPGANKPQAASLCEYLRSVAHLGRMEFILEERRLPIPDSDCRTEVNLDPLVRRNGNKLHKTLTRLVSLPAPVGVKAG